MRPRKFTRPTVDVGALLRTWEKMGLRIPAMDEGISPGDPNDPDRPTVGETQIAAGTAGLSKAIPTIDSMRERLAQIRSRAPETPGVVATVTPEAPQTAAQEVIEGEGIDAAQAAGILYLNAGRVLLLMRGPTAAAFPNCWGFPAGGIEGAESPIEAAIRESKEEVGFAPASPQPLLDADGFSLFLARGESFVPTLNDESSGYVWAPVDALPEPLHPGVADAVLKAVQAVTGGMDEAEELAARTAFADTWALDKSAREFDTNGWPEIKDNPLSKVGIFEYRGSQMSVPDHQRDRVTLDRNRMYRVLRPEEELSSPETIDSFKLLPWIDNHVMLGREESGLTRPEKKGVQGVIGQDVHFKDGTLYGNLKLFSSAMSDLIEAGKKELSCGYRCEYDWTPGNWRGQPYDAVQRKIRGNHLALVKKGRMGPDVAVLDHSDTVMTFTCDSTFETTTMPETISNTAAAGGSSGGLSLEEMRAKFADFVGKLDEALKAAAELKGHLGAEGDSATGGQEGDPAAAEAIANGADKEARDKAARDEEIGFERLLEELKKDGHSEESARKIAAAIGRAKYGEKAMAEKSAAAREADGKDARGRDAETEEERKRREEEEKRRNEGERTMDEAETIRRISVGIAARDKLASQVAKHIGAFDCAAMDEQQVAEYGCRKLGLKVPKGHESTALGIYFASNKPPSEQAVAKGTMDGGDWLKKQEAGLGR